MSIFNTVVQQIKTNKEKREAGKIIAIPFPFPRFSEYVPGIQKERYIIITANAKVGKSKITDYIMVYSPVDYILNNPNCGADIKIDYFTLEMSKESKIKQFVAHNLFLKHDIRLGEEEIDSIFDRYILEDHILRKIEALEPDIEKFESKVNFIDNIRNPFGIYKHVRDWHEANGIYVDKDLKEIPLNQIKNTDKTISDQATFAIFKYVPNNPDLFYEIVVDHVGLTTPERGESVKETIEKLSSKYAIRMRDRWKAIVVYVQQQAASTESVENMKLSATKPTPAGLGESKLPQRDCDIMLGLYAPVRYKIRDYMGYNIASNTHSNVPLLDNHRELETLINRRGGGMISTQLYFDGAVNFFKELPKPDDVEGMKRLNTMLNLTRQRIRN